MLTPLKQTHIRHAVILLHAEAMFRRDEHEGTLANDPVVGKRLSGWERRKRAAQSVAIHR